MLRMQKLGIFGGTFDPVHWGHLLIAETALNQKALDQVIWVPTHCPPHKQAEIFEHRAHMVQLAIQEHPAFVTSLVEAKRSGPSYSFQTLLDLQAFYPNTHWFWIVGLDTFQSLPYWNHRRELAAMCDWIVAPRLVSMSADLEKSGTITVHSQLLCKQVEQQLAAQSITIRWQTLNTPMLGVSSSLIRQYCCDRRSIRYLVPDAVRVYIATHGLYSCRSQ